jgi:hypothetical protein
MFVLLYLLLLHLVAGQCVWHPPATMFPKLLVRVFKSNWEPRRRLGAIYNVGQQDENTQNVITGATSETGGGPANAIRSSNNYTGGLDDSGNLAYDIVFDKAFATPNMVYEIVQLEPVELFQPVDLTVSDDKVVIVRINHESSEALEFEDTITVWVGVRSPCLLEHEIARVSYDFDVSATYDLYHSYNNTLAQGEKRWTERGWISDASIVMHPPMHFLTNLSLHYVDSPCAKSWIDSSLQVVNTSQYTYWDLDTRQYFVSNQFIGSSVAIPRCHRREHGNVCSVIAKVRLTFGDCRVPVKFSVSQAVSQMARLTRIHKMPPNKPYDFNASRRAPVPDNDDMRYDMCESRACEDDTTCTPLKIENTGLMHDGNITIEQHDVLDAGYIETVCHFEVIGFLDNIWSPHIYFRQWVGYNFTV